MRKPLDCDEFLAALDGWAGRTVAVRVVSEGDDLLAVFTAELGTRSHDKHPALFWPLEPVPSPMPDEGAEKPGVYLHPERFESAAVHVGGTVLELRQAGVTLNLRKLSNPGARQPSPTLLTAENGPPMRAHRPRSA